MFSNLAQRLYTRRRSLATVLYGCVVAGSYLLAYLLRFDFRPPAEYLVLFGVSVLPLVIVRLSVFHLFRLTRERWRYAGIRDIARLVAAVVNGSAVLVILDVAAPQGWHVPLSIVALEGILTCWLTASVWVLYRMRFEHSRRRGQEKGISRRVLVIGAGEAGNMLVREMLRFPTGYVPVGFVDDDPAMWGATVQGLEVVGGTRDLSAIAEATGAEEIILAIPSAEPPILRAVVVASEATGLPFKVLPGIREVLAGNVNLNQLRDVQIEDLLGREPINLELPELAEDLRGQSVLVTGAAGSIGAELCRQVALHDPAVLVLFDQAETDLFYIEMELRERFPDVLIVPVIGDIVDSLAIERVFQRYEPSRVFHAAAYKHVPMMETNAREAIRNNVIGTWRIAAASGRHRVEKFVLVSTDKAVTPSNVMGATKRLAELTVLDMQTQFPETAFGAVRFGNVLGSNGSVIPIFKRQLLEGKPLTVTDPETTRYFMTIPEAVQLILQASLLDSFRGHIAMLEMGEPVRIADLAQNLLQLSGVPVTGNRIVYTGLRPGEKLHEKLSSPDEEAQATSIPKVRLLRSPSMTSIAMAAHVQAWDARLPDDDALLKDFFELFPDLTRSISQLSPPALKDRRTTAALRSRA